MENSALIIVGILLVVVVVLFLKIALKIRKVGGSMVTNLHGSTYEFLSKDKQEAVEEIVEMKAQNKKEIPESGEQKS